jgi:cell division protein FtsB
MKQFDMAMELRNLKNEKLHYQKELKNIIDEEKQVLGSYSSLEKYGREKYLMKKEGETLFVLVDDNDKVFEEKD